MLVGRSVQAAGMRSGAQAPWVAGSRILFQVQGAARGGFTCGFSLQDSNGTPIRLHAGWAVKPAARQAV